MGKALYREYRPKSLSEVVGQEHITTTLQNAIKKGSISHAYLFTGPRGVGKTSVARIFAHDINKIKYTDESTELDIIEIDAASNRRIDEVRELRDKVHIAPTSSKYKVYIIDEVHMLTREAFNALLKTLEEPPEHAVFILATTESHKVPDTIISRTQRFTFKPINNLPAMTHLRYIADNEGIEITDEALELIINHGNGSFRDSISMLDQITGFGVEKITASSISSLLGFPDKKILESLIEAVAQNNVNELFESIQSLREKGANASKIAKELIKILKHNIIENNQVLDNQKSVKIMKTLLPLTGTHSSYESIEIALLDAIDFKTAATFINSKNEQKQERIVSKPIIKEAESAEIEGSKNKVKEMLTNTEIKAVEERVYSAKVSSKELTNEQKNNNWEDVLETLKKNHNTLYGVLRMAEIKLESEKIILTFQFEFHKKQLNNSKNISSLKKIIDEKLGEGYVIETEVVKKQKNTQENKAITEENDSISSVSNIFGGAELLES